MRFNSGDKVLFLREKGEGIVCRYKSESILVVEDLETGFEREFLEKDLGAIYGNQKIESEAIEITVKTIDNEQELIKSDDRSSKYLFKNGDFWEADLHTHQILDRDDGKTNHEFLLVQFETFLKCFHEANERRVRKLVIIHGVGKGVLKAEICHFLEGQMNIEFYDADYREYGKGATTIEFHYH